jgi:hypothetical protein
VWFLAAMYFALGYGLINKAEKLAFFFRSV